MKIHNCEQRSEEWYKIKDLKFSASHATAIMAAGKGLETLVNEMLVEHYSSKQYEEYLDNPNNRHIQRGIDFEDRARQIYELETGNKVEQVGFIEYDEYSGCSPDGLVGEYGLLEIKNISDKRFMDLLLTGKVDSNHRNQIQAQLFFTKRHWCDYFAFNPNFNPCYVRITFKPNAEDMQRLREGLTLGKQMLIAKKNRIDEFMKSKIGRI